ncbi:MAG TPA: hypothetical protein VN641_12135 [Urbifossiella sp.]|jgi:hypothetical protein|nr:hypothetical protein [Urbifossiella sp.]
MHDNSPRQCRQWRITLVEPAAARELPFVRRPIAPDEQPGPDGIRHGLVARIRREIAAGTYLTEERWHAAEELLLSRIS